MMKYCVFVLFAVAIVSSCKNNNGNFVVEGKIKGAPEDSVYLEKLSYNSADTKVLDSSKLDKDGNFKLRGADTQQNLYVVSIKHSPAVIVVNDGGKINVDFDVTSFHYPSINGSVATQQLYNFIKDFWQKDSAISLTYSQLDSLSKQIAIDTPVIATLQQQYTKQLLSLGNVIKNFIHTSKNPAAICFALDKAKGAISSDDLSALVQDASKRFPQHSGILAFKEDIENQMSTTSNNSLINKPAPDLTMPDVNGKNVSISDFKGKYLLVDFWASWCGPCRQENPNVVAAYNKFKNKNFAVLGVSLDENKSDWINAIKHDKLQWAQMSDLKQWESAAISAYHFDGIPFNVLIDPSGKIIAESLRGPMLEQKLNEVLQ